MAGTAVIGQDKRGIDIASVFKRKPLALAQDLLWLLPVDILGKVYVIASEL